jgi:hypothetical protein
LNEKTGWDRYKPVFRRSSQIRNSDGLETGPRLRSWPVHHFSGPNRLRSSPVSGFLAVLGLDFQTLPLMLRSHRSICLSLTTTLNVIFNRLWAPPYTTNTHCELNWSRPDLIWPDWPTTWPDWPTTEHLTIFEHRPGIWHQTYDRGRTIHTSSQKSQPWIMTPGNSEPVFLPSQRTCWRHF